MPETREHRVAIALAEDGQHIAPHFGSAPSFLVLTVRKGKVLSREERANHHKCIHSGGSLGCWEVMETLLPDVRAVISAGMGENAYVGLLRRDVLPLVTEEHDVEAAIYAYLHNELRENPNLVHDPYK